MNFSEYEISGHGLYHAFAKRVVCILRNAISSAEPAAVRLPQSYQSRSKSPDSLKRKLADRGLSSSNVIEAEIKDLAGVRIIFYTRADVDRLVHSRLIPKHFDVEWAETKIHYPTREVDDQRYEAIHYIVKVKSDSGIDVDEYSGLRCEIQIQTILAHAWAEISHDMLYKARGNEGFGTEALAAIEKRLHRVMDSYLRPAEFDLQKVQRDYERLMQGKALFDEGPIESLMHSVDNYERKATLETVRDQLVPNYDDIHGIFPGLREAILEAVFAARDEPGKPKNIRAEYLRECSASEVANVAIEILDHSRYVDVLGTLETLFAIIVDEPDEQVRKNIDTVAEHLAQYNLGVLDKVGLSVQAVLADAIGALKADERKKYRRIVKTIWQQLLSSEAGGETYSSNAITIRKGALKAGSELSDIRTKAIDELFTLYDESEKMAEKVEIFHALSDAMRTPSQIMYSNELCATTLRDTARIFEKLKDRIYPCDYLLLEQIESQALFEYYRADEIARDEKFECYDVATELRRSILSFRDSLNASKDYVKFKVLVGFEGVFEPQWAEGGEEFEPDELRRCLMLEYVSSVNQETEGEWAHFIKACASVQSEDGATFIQFDQFLYELAKTKPEIAMKILLQGSDSLKSFLAPFLNGFAANKLFESNYVAFMNELVDSGQNLLAIGRHVNQQEEIPLPIFNKLLDKAIAEGDHKAATECLALAVKKDDPNANTLMNDGFLPALKYLKKIKEPYWVGEVWFLKEAREFFLRLPENICREVLGSIAHLPRINLHAERLLAYIAYSFPKPVFDFIADRFANDQDATDGVPYAAIPYKFHDLKKPLRRDVGLAVQTVRGWYNADDPLFRFRGGRLLANVFGDADEAFIEELNALVKAGTDEDLQFIFCILEHYHFAPNIRSILKDIIKQLPEDDERLDMVTLCIDSSGVVSGEFGFANSFKARKAIIETWIEDPSLKVKKFAENYVRVAEQRIASEYRSAEQDIEQRKRDFHED